MKQILLLAAIYFVMLEEASAQQPTQVTVQDDAKVGLIVTGTGNTINTTQIFGKSPEYAELKKRLDGLAAAISKKADECEQMRRDSLPSKYCDNCRAELIALNAERDSVQKIETRFREDVIRLAEAFSKIELNNERLRLAKHFFDTGEIREADNILNVSEMQIEGDALLAKKELELKARQKTDSLLRIKADEFALKAMLKATDYADSLRYDSATLYFEQSRRYAETVDNLRGFAELLFYDNQVPSAINYGERAMQLSRSESEEAMLSLNLGNYYFAIQKMKESEKMYLRAMEIRERLAKVGSTQFESDLATTYMNLGVYYNTVQKTEESEKMYLHAMEIYERLAKQDSAQIEPHLGKIYGNLGNFYISVNKMAESEKMYLRALEIWERLAKSNPVQFEPEVARSSMNLGNFYDFIRKNEESETMYLRAMEFYERLASANPAQFEPDLALTCINMGVFHIGNQRMDEAESFCLQSLQIYERLAKQNPEQFEFYLAYSLNLSGRINILQKKFAAAEQYYNRSIALFQKIMIAGQTYYKEYLDEVFSNTAALRDSFTFHLDYSAAVVVQRERALCMDTLCVIDSTYLQSAVSAYNILARLCLFARQYPEAETAAEKVLSLDPSQNWVRTNLGHSWLLRGEWKKARQVYKQYIANEQDPAQAKTTLLKDLDDLQAAGAIPKERMNDVEKARAWVKE